MKKMRLIYGMIYLLVLTMVFTSCDDAEDIVDEITDPVASFQSSTDEDNFFLVTFINASSNATSYSWDFGDGVGTSTEESPSYTYTAGGTFTVTLTASNDGGGSSSFSSDILITDPDEALTLLAGLESKTWKLMREGAAMGIGPDAATWFSWWTLSNDGSRPCLFDDEFIFNRDGSFEYAHNNTFWGEASVWTTDSDRASLNEVCFEPTTDNMTVNGVDLSAWLGGNSMSFDYSTTDNNITLSGTGAWMGLVQLGTNESVTTPQQSVSYTATVIDGADSGVDTLIVDFDYASIGNFWKAIYVSYEDINDEPELIEEVDVIIIEEVIDAFTIDFETENTAFGSFGAASPSVVDNPVSGGINTSSRVGQVDETDGGEGWSGISTQLDGKIDFSTKQDIKLQVYSPFAGAVIKLKLESSANSDDNKEIDLTTTAADTWEELTYTFSTEDTEKWDVLVLFFDFQTESKVGARTHYFDEISF